MARKMSKERMLEHIRKGSYYITYYPLEEEKDQWSLCQTYADGRYKSEIGITKERAQEWIALGAEMDTM